MIGDRCTPSTDKVRPYLFQHPQMGLGKQQSLLLMLEVFRLGPEGSQEGEEGEKDVIQQHTDVAVAVAVILIDLLEGRRESQTRCQLTRIYAAHLA